MMIIIERARFLGARLVDGGVIFKLLKAEGAVTLFSMVRYLWLSNLAPTHYGLFY